MPRFTLLRFVLPGLLVGMGLAISDVSFNRLGVAQMPSVDDRDRTVEFNRDIRPILSDKCFSCHGPDEHQRQADLRLDLREQVIADRGGYRVIEPGNSGASELVRRIMSSDADEVMPPADHRKKLSDVEKEVLQRWVDQGAAWQQHWAWISPQPIVTPGEAVEGKANLVDTLIQARLKTAGVAPAPEADRRTLLRRVYFDLVGLPPTPEQVQQFVANQDPNAYEQVVDELLQSRHYGERMAGYWLDLVRYADTVGYHGDQDVSVSPYRDYVIDAFNENLPFDQFTREQLAGDLLESPTDRQRIASGYNRLGMMSAEGGVQPEEYLIKYAADRVRTTASVWLGVTLGCAECHDHKFDPFTSRDFYSFAAFFADIKERGLYSGANSDGNWGPNIEVPDPELADLLQPIDAELATRQTELTAARSGLLPAQQAWEAEWLRKREQWQVLKPTAVLLADGSATQVRDDGVVLVSGSPPDGDCYFVTVDLPVGTHRGLRLEALPDPSLPQQGPGRAGNGNFVVTELSVLASPQADTLDAFKRPVDQWTAEQWAQCLPLHQATASFEQEDQGDNPYKKFAAASLIDRDQYGAKSGWAIAPGSGQAHQWVAQFQTPMIVETPTSITVVIQQYHRAKGHLLGCFRLATTADAQAEAEGEVALPEPVRTALETGLDQRTAKQVAAISDYYFSVAPEIAEPRQRVNELQQQRAAVVQAHTRTSLVTLAVEPRETRVLPRGDWQNHSGAVVEPGLPEFLGMAPASEGARMTRLDLANWLVDRGNPLTARVLANRLWKMYFGTGLSKVLDDLGSQGEWPSHPQLLDALAIELMDSGWDVKHLVKLIVTSQTYRQSSTPRAELATLDPYNRLLARQSRFRLDAELIRDNSLAVSGLLVREIGGRSVKPYQPEGLYRHLNFPQRTYQPDDGENQYRRGLYTHWQRQFLHPALKAFDAPSREECTCDRPRSNTPVGALVLLNDPSYVEAARKLAEETLRAALSETDARIQMLFERALSRRATSAELEVLVELAENHLAHYQAVPDEAARLIHTGIAPTANDLEPAELAAWTSVARTILNLHEFVTRY